MYNRKLPDYVRLLPNKRPKNKETRFYIDNEILEVYASKIGTYGIVVYNALAKHAHSNDQICWPKYETLMKETGIGNKNTISKYLKILEKVHLIKVWRKHKKVNYYCLLSVSAPEKDMRCNNKGINKDTHNSTLVTNNSINSDTVSHRMKSYNKINSSYKEAVPARPEDDLHIKETRSRGITSIWDAMSKLGYKSPDKQDDN
jgi:hypothetical protein